MQAAHWRQALARVRRARRHHAPSPPLPGRMRPPAASTLLGPAMWHCRATHCSFGLLTFQQVFTRTELA